VHNICIRRADELKKQWNRRLIDELVNQDQMQTNGSNNTKNEPKNMSDQTKQTYVSAYEHNTAAKHTHYNPDATVTTWNANNEEAR